LPKTSVAKPLETMEKFDNLTAKKPPCPVRDPHQPPLTLDELAILYDGKEECFNMPGF
jgi:hypothetical protein